MNPNFDFRSDSIWDDREVTSSVGEDFDSALNAAAVVIGAVLAVLIVGIVI